MNQGRQKHRQIDGQGTTEVNDEFVPVSLAASAKRTLAAIDILADHREKLRAAGDDFRVATRTVAAAEQAAAARDMGNLGHKLATLSDANAQRDEAAAAIIALTKQVHESEQDLSALQDELCKAAAAFLNPMRATAAAKFRDVASELRRCRDRYVELALAGDADLAVMARAMRGHLPDLEGEADLLFSPRVPDCPAHLELVRRAIRGARLAAGW